MTNFKTEFFFKDSSGMLLHTAIEFIEAEDYDEACDIAEEVAESMCAQDFNVIED